MSKRLQVLLDDKELREIQRVAKQQQLTVAEWVRQVLRSARQKIPTGDHHKKLAILRTATQRSFPTGDIDLMLQEIEQSYSSNLPTWFLLTPTFQCM